MIMFTSLFLAASFALGAYAVATHTHDATFVPDATLHITARNISIGGIQRYTTLVNGTVPGPELRLTEGETVWIRVYNDLENLNTTIVSYLLSSYKGFD